MAPAAKVFGIGLRKTGTRSMARATRILGLRTLHKGDAATSEAVDRAAEAGGPLLDAIGPRYDAYFDVEGLLHRFTLLDAQYPGSRFVLTTRDEDAWLDSLERHVRANQARRDRGEPHGHLLVLEPARWREERAQHHDAVARHFAGREGDLLVIDVCEGGEGWTALAPFLDRPVPSTPFPWENREGLGTYRPTPWATSMVRRSEAVFTRVRRRFT